MVIVIDSRKNPETIILKITLEDMHKNILRVNEHFYECQARSIINRINLLDGFRIFTLGFGCIDWYESCNSYDVPYFSYSKTNTELKKTYLCYNDTPKDWEIIYFFILLCGTETHYPWVVGGVPLF